MNKLFFFFFFPFPGSLVSCRGQFLVLFCQLDCLPSSGWPSSPWFLFCQGGRCICALYPRMLRESTCQTDRQGDFWLPLDMENGTFKSLHSQPWAFKKLSVRDCTLSSRNNHIGEYLAFMLLRCILYFSLILSMLVLLHHRSFSYSTYGKIETPRLLKIGI